jgi:hypothetical protein
MGPCQAFQLLCHGRQRQYEFRAGWDRRRKSQRCRQGNGNGDRWGWQHGNRAVVNGVQASALSCATVTAIRDPAGWLGGIPLQVVRIVFKVGPSHST